MDGKEQALGDRKCLYLITSRCSSFILVPLYSINMFINYRFLVILQACVMFCVSPSRISSSCGTIGLFFCLEEETCELVFLFNTKEVRNV